jgi:hypothetical protein
MWPGAAYLLLLAVSGEAMLLCVSILFVGS